ncbi:GNAT family N-acetyltransferase [Streptomyces sp. WP-1]|uniref:GNAT family N-acetyltransferase n=1 Tax=Streptomyces sp. WP-1 TaxID=3041497 RepID=UPI002649A790|nr:GNAT family N-acetyltransferase [Streptomyces sp. WP-1]WKE71035.1 GNAT family N-acetyltransferase [Streptomyces sp. WP-1]
MTPHPEEITPRNFEAALGIRVRPDEEHAVEPVERSLAEAYAHPPGVAWPRLDIAAGEQRRGYGRFAVASVGAEIRRRGGCELYVTWHPGADGPERFHLRLGFRGNGETSGGQTVGGRGVGDA